jgi:hypothetical protein
MMTESELFAADVEKRYFPVMNENPIFQDVVAGLIDAGLYTSALYVSSSDAFKDVGEYKNGNAIPNSAVPLDVIIDIITRCVFKAFRDGFKQKNLFGVIEDKDAASNISFKTSIPSLSNITDTGNCTNVREVIDTLTAEVIALKTATALLVPNVTQKVSITEANKLNKLILE